MIYLIDMSRDIVQNNMRLLLTGAYNYSEEQIDEIMALGYKITFIKDERDFIDIDVSDFEAVVCNGLFLNNDIAKFKKLKYIQLTSAGLDRVPIDYINEHGIELVNARGVYSIPMAEWVILKILEIYKNSKEFYRFQDEHNWKKKRDLLELTDKNVAIIGFGDVGIEVATRLKAFGVKIIGVGRSMIKSDLLDEYYTIEYLDEVLKKSDIVVLTIPLTDETYHFIGKEEIRAMKNNCVLINVSRGGVICQNALIEALQSGKYLGVALDVFESEPLLKDNPLWDIDNVIITPHNSFISDKVRDRLFQLIINGLANVRAKR